MATIASMSVQLSAGVGGFTAGLMKAESAVAMFRTRVESGISNSLASMAKLGTASVGLAATLGALSAVKIGFENAAQSEQMLATLELMTGSMASAKSMFSEMQALSAKTALSQQDVVKGAISLLQGGFSKSDIGPLMTLLTDASAANPESMAAGLGMLSKALVDVKVKGKLTGEEVRQLNNSMIPIADILSTRMGVTAAEVMDEVSKGAIGSKAAIEAVLEYSQQRFAGLAVKQSETLGGLWSTMGDEASTALGEVAAALSDSLGVKQGMKDLTGWLGDMKTSAKEVAGGIASVVSPIIEMGGAFKDLAFHIAPLAFDTLRQTFGDVFGGSMTKEVRSWRAFIIDTFEDATLFGGLFGDAAFLVVKSVSTGWDVFWHNFKAGFASMEAAYHDLMAMMSVLDDTIAHHREQAALSRRIAGQHAGQRDRVQAAFNQQNADFWKAQGPLAMGAKNLFAGFRAAERQRELDGLTSSINGFVDSLRIWNQTNIDVSKLDSLRESAAAFGIGNVIGPVMELQAMVVNMRDQMLNDQTSAVARELEIMSREDRTPSAILAGTAEAYSMAVQARITESAEERLAEAMRRVSQQAEAQTKLQKDIRDALDKQGRLVVAKF